MTNEVYNNMQARPISKVMNCNCLDYMRTLPDKFFDLSIADPPYGWGNGEGDRTGGSWSAKYGKKIKEWDTPPTKEWFDELERVSKNRIIWGANYFTMMPCRCFIIWKKLTISEAFTMAMAEYAWTSFNINAKVVELPPQGKQGDLRFHPTQKPIDLYAWCLRTFAREGDKIFDPMMGSQSSRIAAYKMGFDYVGCELDKEYFDKGCERFDRVCRGITTGKNGKIYQQTSLF